MTKEEKELLLKDLSARLQYGLILHDEYNKKDYELKCIDANGFINYDLANTITYIKPYLRPLSSMTEEERLIYEQRLHDVGRSIDVIDADDVVSHIDWLLERHFDFRGLIPMGLALEAPEGMYNNI